MELSDDPAIQQMQRLIGQWEVSSDPRVTFLSCYMMMTSNMLLAIEKHDFKDPPWVNQLLHCFADYYFIALDAYDRQPASAPPIWKVTHDLTLHSHVVALQKMVLGVNAHINYDLVMALVEIQKADWASLSDLQRHDRYLDHCHVNDIIGQTIDAVQDQVLEKEMPVLDLIDRAFGRMDERMISGFITHWRETVWQYATALLETRDPAEQTFLAGQVEAEALQHADAIGLRSWRAMLSELL